MARIIRKTIQPVRIIRKVVRVKLSNDERAFLELAAIVASKNGDENVKLSEVVMTQCDASDIVSGLRRRGLVEVQKRGSKSFTLSEDAAREAIRCLDATAA